MTLEEEGENYSNGGMAAAWHGGMLSFTGRHAKHAQVVVVVEMVRNSS